MQPSFKKVLQSRRVLFQNRFKLDASKSEKIGLNEFEVKKFVDLIIDSILNKDVYSHLIAFHYDLDILLDVVMCLLLSPFLPWTSCRDLMANGETVPWHYVLDSMQRYRYKNFYEGNSFIINLFDNGQRPPTSSNTLIRVRLLQVLRHQFKGVSQGIKVGYIYADMKELGYGKEAVTQSLIAISKSLMISTGQLHNSFDQEVRTIIPKNVIIFYIDNLIYHYRYIQNILPVTPINFNLPIDLIDSINPLMGSSLSIVSKNIHKFINFLEICEKKEKININNMELFREITRDIVLSEELKKRIDRQIQDMKNYRRW